MLIEEVELIQEIATIDLFQLYNFRSFIGVSTCLGAGGGEKVENNSFM